MLIRSIESCNKKSLFVTGKVEENGQYSYRIATFDWTRPWVTTPGDRWGAWVNQSPTVIPIDSVLRRFCLTWATCGNDNQTKLNVESGCRKTSNYRWWAVLPVIMVTEKVIVGSKETKNVITSSNSWTFNGLDSFLVERSATLIAPGILHLFGSDYSPATMPGLICYICCNM